MLDVTWEWLGQGLALDLADTVNVLEGEENDLISDDADYERWARRETEFLPDVSFATLMRARSQLMELRSAVRGVIAALADGERPAKQDIATLNRASRSASSWVELNPQKLLRVERTGASEVARVVSLYARSAIELVATKADQLSRCPAPSCGMFYVRSRPQQTWCSVQCGTRARVARHYRKRRSRA